MTKDPAIETRRIIERVQHHRMTPEEGFESLKILESESMGRLVYHPVWELHPGDPNRSRDRIEGNLLIFDQDHELFDTIETGSSDGQAADMMTFLVTPGDGFRQTAPNTFTVRPDRSKDYRRLISALAETGKMPAYILHIWSQDPYADNEQDLKTHLARGILSVFHLTRALMDRKPDHEIRLLFGFEEAGDRLAPQYSAVSGFAKTVRLENPKFRYKTVAFADRSQIPDLFTAEFNLQDGVEVRYHAGNRYVRRMSPSVPMLPGDGETVFKEGGVYLLTGGAGSVGRIMAGYIAQQVKARIVLAGRSRPAKALSAKLQTLEHSGSKILYMPSDVSRSEDVATLVDDIRSRFHRLDGVIHCAGVIRDDFILKKKTKDLLSVLKPKILGAVHLDHATRDDRLDFFVLFSSISSVTGNPGQCDYAVANTFLDHFAHLRNNRVASGKRWGRTVSINWPFWQEGGMRIDEEKSDRLTEKIGMFPLPADDGLAAFEDAVFRYRQCQHLVLYGNKKQLQAFMSNPDPDVQNRPHPPAAGVAKPSTGKIEHLLRQVLSDLLKWPVERIEPDINLEEFGIDSIIVNQFNDRMEAMIGPLPKTLLFECQTVSELAGVMAKDYSDQLDRLFSGSGKDVSAPAAVGADDGDDRTATKQPVADRPVPVHGHAALDAGGGIAVIGVSCRFPKAQNIDAFWENLRQGRDCVTEIPKDRWDYRSDYHPDPRMSHQGKSYCKWGAFLEGVEHFDAPFFKISPREAEVMDPQERLFLESCWSVLEDAGYTRHKLKAYNVGVYAGVTTQTYMLWGPDLHRQAKGDLPISMPWSIANRVSYLFDFHGPSLPVDTACSSSLVALHMACESLKQGACDMALAGGVNLYLHPLKYVLLCQGQMLSSKGRCRSFGIGADGFVPGEGVGVVLLKPLERAVRDRDYIYGVIKGSAINHGGRTSGYTVPNPNAQAVLIRDALCSAGFDPRTVSYVEAHGTGTDLGDPVEIRGLTRAFQEYSRDRQYCAIGSVKSNIGHLESAAGVAGLIKILLQFRHRQLTPSLHCGTLNPKIDFKDSPFYVQQDLSEWKQPNIRINGRKETLPRRAGLSSFGAGGANAHVVVEEYQKKEFSVQRSAFTVEPQLIVLSAKNEDRLKVYAKAMVDYIDSIVKEEIQNPKSKIQNIAYTLQTGREAMPERLAVVASGPAELKEKLQGYVRGQSDHDTIFWGNARKEKSKSKLLGGRSGKAFVRLSVEDREVVNLGRLWVMGVDIDWDLLHSDKQPCRIPLPTYPFARKRYWIEFLQDRPGVLPVLKDRYRSDGETDHRCLFYRDHWEASSPDSSNDRPDQPQAVLIFENQETGKSAFRHRDKANLLFVRSGDRFEETAGGFVINPATQEDYLRLFRRLRKIGRFPATIHHLWALGENGDMSDAGSFDFKAFLDHPEGSTPSIHSDLIHGAYSVFHIIRAVSEIDKDSALRILFAFHAPEASANPLQVAVSGFARSLKLILPRLSLTTVRVEEETEIVDALYWETPLTGAAWHPEVRYAAGQRWIRTVRPLSLSGAEEMPLRNRGVYLITGGIGGLGSIFARYLAEHFEARLALVGRSSLDDPKSAVLKEMKRAGGEVLHLKADVADFDAMNDAVSKIKETFGAINGVIHGAGVIFENPVNAKSFEEFQATLRPKIDGSIVLDHVFGGEELDFFMMLSSTAAVLGDTGQCDYAVANRFMDSYALFREQYRRQGLRSGRSISVNWPLWRDGGMNRNREGEKFYLKTSGLSYLETPEGLSAFQQILKSDIDRVILIKGDPDRIDGILDRPPEPEAESRPVSFPKVIETTVDLKSATEQEIQKTAAAVLKAPPKDLDIRESLGDFGFDSISLKILADRLGETYGIELPPSIFFAHSTIESLAGYLMDTAEAEIRNRSGSKASAFQVTGARKARAVVVEEKPMTVSQGSAEPMAVIGMHGIFPGSKNPAELWKHLESGEDLITQVPKNRWNWEDVMGDPIESKDRTNAKWGGFIEDVDAFDPLFFRISPREAAMMDPQHRLFLETVWKTIEDAAIPSSTLSGRDLGVFVGVQFNDYEQLLTARRTSGAQMATGNARTMIANRVSYFMNWHGPSESIDTACSSSLVAVHRAIQSIPSGECDMAVAGGVSLLLSPGTLIGADQLGVLSPEGRCRTFDASADGYVKGEGVAAVLLKPLKQAIRDRDHIYAVIRGSAVNHGGKANSLTAPNSESQAALLVSAYESASIGPESVTYMELHGTGTELGDPVEIEGIKKAFERLAAKTGMPLKTGYCGLGSVKTHIGHMEPAAGIAGLFKVILSMKHGKLPGTLHLKRLNPYIHLENTPFYIVEKTVPWKLLSDGNGGRMPRRAGISSFGFGGANAHVVVEEFDDGKKQSTEGMESELKAECSKLKGEPQLIVLSAKNEDRLKAYAEKLLEFVKSAFSFELSAFSLPDIAYTLQTGREAMEERLAVIAGSLEDLRDRLGMFAAGKEHDTGIFRGRVGEEASGSSPEMDEGSFRTFVGNALKNKALDKLARLWVAGWDVNWRELHTDPKPKRIPLPTYPFVKERYWMSGKSNYPITHKLHPLIDGIDARGSLENGVVFKKILKKTDSIVDHHRVRHQRLMPGDVFMEMAYAAGRLIHPDKRFKLTGMRWRKPLAVETDQKEIRIVIRSESDYLTFQVQGREGDQVVVYASGNLHPQPSAGASSEGPVSIAEIKARCTHQMDRETFYRRFQEKGVIYRKYFKGVLHAWGNRGESLCRLQLPEAYVEELASYTFHPTLTDSAFQAISGLNPDQDLSDKPLTVHFAIEEAEMHRPLSADGYAHVKAMDSNRFHIDVLDAEGRICTRFLHVRVGEIPDPLEGFFFKPRWVPLLSKPVEAAATSDASTGTGKKRILIVYSPDSLGLEKALAALYPSDRVHKVRLGIRNRQYSKHAWEVRTLDAEALDHCVSRMPAMDAIFFLGAIQSRGVDSDDPEALAPIQERGILSLFRLVKSLIRRNRMSTSKELTVLTNDVYWIDPDDVVNPLAGSLNGFTRGIAREYPHLSARCIDIRLKDISEKPSLKELKRLLTPIVTGTYRIETTALRDGRWYEQKIDPVRVPFVFRSPFRDRGVYFILGGGGGIGLEFGLYLARTVHARLALIGRREPDAHQRAKMADMEKAGGEVLYFRADAVDEAQMQKAVAAAKSRFGPINGVVHSAIVLNDRSLRSMNEDALQNALAPKVRGSVVLHKVFKGEPLDFMLFFSSLQSLAGNAGQSNYAAACTFKDAFAHYLRRQVDYPVKVMNWGYWGSVGIASDMETRQRMAFHGVGSVEPEEGMEGIRRVLLSPMVQAAAFRMAPKVLETLGIEQGTFLVKPAVSALKKPSGTEPKIPREGKDRFIARKVTETFIHILNMGDRALNPDTPYTDYGVDSIMAVDIIDRLNSEFGIELRTTDLFNYPTLRQLSRYVMEGHGNAIDDPDEKQMELHRLDKPLPDKPIDAGGATPEAADIPEAHSDVAVLNIFDRLKTGDMDVGEAYRLLGVSDE